MLSAGHRGPTRASGPLRHFPREIRRKKGVWNPTPCARNMASAKAQGSRHLFCATTGLALCVMVHARVQTLGARLRTRLRLTGRTVWQAVLGEQQRSFNLQPGEVPPPRQCLPGPASARGPRSGPTRAGACVRCTPSIPLAERSRASIQARRAYQNQARNRGAPGRPPRASLS